MNHDRYSDRRPKSVWVVMLIVLAIIIAVIGGIYWFFAGALADSIAVNARGWGVGWQFAFFPGGIWPTPFAVTLIALALLIASIIWGMHTDWDSKAVVASVVSVVLILGAGVLDAVKSVNYNIDGSHYYLSTTLFAVENPDQLPDILAKQASLGNVTLPIEKGSLPTGWVPRVASATGALNVIKKTGDAVNNTSLMENTISYVYGEGNKGVWTAIRNGANQQAIYGVASWNGTGDSVQTCQFAGDYKLDKAFGGI